MSAKIWADKIIPNLDYAASPKFQSLVFIDKCCFKVKSEAISNIDKLSLATM